MGWLSSLFGGGGARRRQEKENAMQSFDIAQDSITAYGNNRSIIAEQFAGNLSTARARMGASGVDTQGSAWQGIMGGLVRGRDEALGKVQAEETAFRQGTAFKLVREDFERMGEVKMVGGRSASKSRDATAGTMSFVSKSSVTGESYLTDEQRGMLRSGGGRRDMEKYAESIRPSFAEYEKYRFGSAEDKAAFSDSMTSRIEASNLKWDRENTARSVADANRDRWNRGGGGRR